MRPSRRAIVTAALAAPLAACASPGRVDRDGPARRTPTARSSDVTTQRLTYGDDPSQWADLSRPPGDSRGVVVVIHGGFWKAEYDASLGEPLAQDLVGRGWTVLNLEYRRVGSGPGGGGGWPATCDDVAAGLDLLRGVDGLSLDTVVTLGHSAGGHLATWAAARGRFDRWKGGVPVTHVISQAGVLDLARAHEEGLGGGAVAAFMGAGPGDPSYAQADPQAQVPLDVPVWCVHGDADTVVPPAYSRDYVRAATAAGGPAELVAVEGDHFVVIDPFSAAWDRTVAVLESL
jgi:acetyl esterase/lipase